MIKKELVLALMTVVGVEFVAAASTAQTQDFGGIRVQVGRRPRQALYPAAYAARGDRHGDHRLHRRYAVSEYGRGHYDWHDTSHLDWHDTTHYDWHPETYIRHRDHYDYVPGHYHLHREGHWDFHPQGHWDHHRGGRFRRDRHHGH
jgi:hypothetical protein